MDIKTLSFEKNMDGIKGFKVYKRRWIVLVLFVAYSASNSLQWIQFSIISNIVMKFYRISESSVDWTSMVYMLLYIPMIFPASWVLEKMGLRFTAILGMSGTCIGAWIKVFGAKPDFFSIAFIGQSVVALSQVFILSLPARLAAVWFGSNQVSSATSIGVFGNQLGCGLGFILPTLIVKNSDDLDDIGKDLHTMFCGIALFTTIVLFFMICFFEDQPPTPPSAAQDSKLQQVEKHAFHTSLNNLFSNLNFILLLCSYGIIVGVFYAISTLLNPVILTYYPGAEVDTGRIGLSIIVSGMLGSALSGLILDKTHKFKETTLVIYVSATVGMWVFALSIDTGSIITIYVTASILGFFMTGYLPVGFEFAAELTYPESEGTSSGILNAGAQICGIVFTMAFSKLLVTIGVISANISLAVIMVLGAVLICFIKSDLRRQNALFSSNTC